MSDIPLTAQDIARELMVDARRVRIEEFDEWSTGGKFIGIKISRDSDQRWKAWREPGDCTTISPANLDLAKLWVKS